MANAKTPLTQKLKIALIAAAAVIVLIVVLQNTESVQTRILFVTIEMPRAAMLFGTLAVGFGLGFLVAGWMIWRKKAK